MPTEGIEEVKAFINKPGTAKALVVGASAEAVRVFNQLQKLSASEPTFSVYQLKDCSCLGALGLSQYSTDVAIFFDYTGVVKDTIATGLSKTQINDKFDAFMAEI